MAEKISQTTDRVDIVKVNDGFRVIQFQKGLGMAVQMDTVTEDRAQNLVSVLESRGWVVRRWVGGSRAFKGGLYPIRTASQILRLRDQLRSFPRPELAETIYSLDLAYDL